VVILIKIFCKSYPPNIGGDGILVSKYLEYGRYKPRVYTVGDGKSPENVEYISNKYDRKYIKKARDIANSDNLIWCHSTRPAIDLRRNLKTNDVITVHGLWGLIPEKTDIWPIYIRNKLAEYIYYRFYCNSTVTTVSPYSARKLSKYVDTVYIPNGVETKNVLNIDKNKKAVFLGRHHPQKDLDFVTKIVRHLVSLGYEVHVGGKPNKHSPIQRWEEIEKLNYGYVDEKEKEELLRKSQFLILPSKWEGFPITILEALSYNCIPIITKYADLNKIDLSDFFLIVNKNNYKSKINKTDYYSYDFEKLQKILREKYSWKEIIKKYDEIFETKL